MRTKRTGEAGAQTEDGAIGGDGKLAARHAAAAVVRREQILDAGRDPLHRPTKPPREPGNENLLAIGPALTPNPAAEVGRARITRTRSSQASSRDS